ncbi:unnamed protein product [Phytophthora fragariaefolia]|uniref:Unnamed protein product n=1 Tax=Phytophthora fragariaefolia TaxID=1490495 RepID=A0A9W6U0X2_9STRA|nr:unnamed protein product [Phytophthora fragariaefolia]
MASHVEEPTDQAINADGQELEISTELDVVEEENQLAEEENGESSIEQAGILPEENNFSSPAETVGLVVEANGDVAPRRDNTIDEDAETDAEDDEDAWEWQLRVVQRMSEGMIDLSLFTSGGFDFVVVLNVQQNALRDLSPIAGMARTLRVLNAAQNEIATLPGFDFWVQFHCLSLCFLSQNALATWADVQGLEGCACSLMWLTLSNNPLMTLKNARSFVVNKFPFLKALDNYVTTDQEVIQHARPNARFNALAPRLCISHLQMPLEFETDDAALLYVGETEAAIASTFADNSPSVRAQKLVRGYLSRRVKFPRFRNVRELVIHVQKHIRGFLLRQLIKRQICDLVAANGESKLLMASVAAGHGYLSPLARRSFEKMLPMIRHWRTHFQARKRAVAIKKIRFWCQMVYQRHARRTRQLLREQQEIWIYYTPEFEEELLTLAARVARRDPYLMTLSREDRVELLRERCAQSGLSVLRGPKPNSNVVRVAAQPSGSAPPPVLREHHFQHEEDEGYKLLRMTRDAQSTFDGSVYGEQNARRATPQGWPALIRAFPRDNVLENRLLVTEKQFLQQDLERIASIQLQHRQAIANSEENGKKSPTRLQVLMKRQSRAVLVHLTQVAREYHLVPSCPSAHATSSKIELWSNQRCSAYFPVWMPGTPDPEPESMSSRFEDAGALLLVDGVQVEPTLMERELMLGITQPPVAEMFTQMNPFREFSICHRVVESATRIMDLAYRLSPHKATRNWQLESSQFGTDSTSFVRLTFESIDEARKRALVLLCKTFDPITKTYAQLFTLEALFGAAFRHHQWALSQAVARDEIDAILDESRVWLQDEFPSRWWTNTKHKLEALHAAASRNGTSQAALMKARAPPTFHVQQIPPREPHALEPVRPAEVEPRGPPRVFSPRRQPESPPKNSSAVPLYLVEPSLPNDAERHKTDPLQPHVPEVPLQPQAPSRSSFPSTTLGSSRHQKLVNRLGKACYACIEDKQFQEQQARDHHVRDLREEGERAIEALIVDRRMLQREKTTEVASIKLDIDVKLQRMRFQRELDQIHVRGALEQQRNTSRRRKLTRNFETSFVAQSGALMRREARAVVASNLKAEELQQQRLAAAVKVREAEALDRRRDAKSLWFVKNRQDKRDMEAVRQLRSADLDKAERNRLAGLQRRINEDNEIKKMLRLL